MEENKAQLPEKPDLNVLPGNEKSLTYKIAPVPKDRGRFGFTWDVFTHRLGKIVYINLLMLVFFTPLIAVFAYRYVGLTAAGAAGAFGDNLGIGYPGSPDTVGLAERLVMDADMFFFALAVLASLFTAAGLAGGVYCIRKLLRSDENFRFKDFFTGIRKGYLPALAGCALSFAVIFVCALVWDYSALQTALGGNKALYIFFRVLVCVVAAVFILFGLWLFSVGSNYRQSVWGLIKNSAALGFGTVLQSVFFAALASLPAVLYFFNVQGLFVLVTAYFCLIGFSVALLIWSSFTDWAFDNFADYTAAQTDAQEKERKKTMDKEAAGEDIFSLLLVDGKNSYLSRAMQSIDEGTQAYELPASFGLEDLRRLAENRETILKESEAFAAAHADEARYKEYNARFADREKALVATDKKGKKKKFAPQMLNRQ